MTDLFGNELHDEGSNGKSKWCPHCERFVALRFFYKNSKSKDGYRTRCKRYDKEKQKEAHSRPHPIIKTEKRCGGCGRVKPISEFAKDPTQTDGLHSYCKECQSDSRKHNRMSKLTKNPKSIKRVAN